MVNPNQLLRVWQRQVCLYPVLQKAHSWTMTLKQEFWRVVHVSVRYEAGFEMGDLHDPTLY